MDAKILLLCRAGRMFVIIIQPGLTDAHHPGMGGLRQQRRGIGQQFFFRFMRMHADAAPYIREAFRHGQHGGEILHFGADADADADTGSPRPFHHSADIAKFRVIQMAMAIH